MFQVQATSALDLLQLIKELKSKDNSTPVTIVSFKGNVYEIAKTMINNLFEPFHARSVF